MDERTRRLAELDRKYIWHPFTQMADWLSAEPVIIDRGEGFFLIDTQGRRYIDGVSSLWCNVHGHKVKKIDDAIIEQLGRISHSTLLGLSQTRSIELAERLIRITPRNLTKLFFSDNGATAVEIAIKIAYQYWQNIGIKKRTKFVALKEAYHGDTVGSVSVGGMELFHGIFKKLLFDTFFVPGPNPYRFKGQASQCADYSLGKMKEILEKNGDSVAAVIMEPLVQGAAGIIVHPEGFLKAVRELASRYGAFLIVDEVATGFGRTGKMFACEYEDVEPDIMCLAKGITAGYLPLAATLVTQKIFDAFLGGATEHKTFYHGHTYTGNALGCAAAIASLELFEENSIIGTLAEKTNMIKKAFSTIREFDYIGDARQCGLMAGVEIVRDKLTKESFPYGQTVGAKLCMAMRPKGLMMRPLGDVIVVMPPLAIDTGLLGQLLNVVTETLKNDLPEIVKGI